MRNLLRILSSARHLRPYYAGIGLFTVLLSLMNLMQPLLAGWGIDELRKGTNADGQRLLLIVIGLFLTDLLANLFSNVGNYLGTQMALKLNHFLSSRYYARLLDLPQQFYDEELSGRIVNRLNRSIGQITNFVQMLSNNFLQFIFTTIFTLIVVVNYSWQVALIIIVLYPLYGYLTARSSGRWQRYQVAKNSLLDTATARFSEVIQQIKVVKSYRQEDAEQLFFDEHYQKAISLNKPQSQFWHTRDFLRRLTINVAFLGVYAFIFWEGANGRLSPGVAVSLILYGMQIRTPIFTISLIIENAQRALADSKDYFEIMDANDTYGDRFGASHLRVNGGKIEYRDVSFGYQPDAPVLSGVTLTVKPRSKVALVGESGEGKTTITNLLMRLYEPDAGAIYIDGQNIGDVTLASLRAEIGVVFQEAALFSGTIRDNIAYAKPRATDAEVIEAAQAANAHEFIAKLDKGYHTEIGERGVKLSGGQKQRIAIARALLKDAPILILDEATSALDNRSEALVQEALERLMQDRTTIIIAHRLSTISHVDQIVTVKKGSVDETGTPAELSQSGGIYAQLLHLQERQNKKTQERLKAFGIKTE